MSSRMDASTPPAHRQAPGPFFLRKFLRAPGAIASVWPSSRRLAAAMLDGVAFGPDSAVVELGPGTGPFTDLVAARLGGSPGHRYLGIDRDPDFVAFLRRRHPHLEFVVADAAELPTLLAARPALRPTAVVSGLPLVAMPERVVAGLLDTIHGALPAGGHFRTFSYLHTTLNPASWRLRRDMRNRFAEFQVHGPILGNLPPALVFAARR